MHLNEISYRTAYDQWLMIISPEGITIFQGGECVAHMIM